MSTCMTVNYSKVILWSVSWCKGPPTPGRVAVTGISAKAPNIVAFIHVTEVWYVL
jgi:hypothetical protein